MCEHPATGCGMRHRIEPNAHRHCHRKLVNAMLTIRGNTRAIAATDFNNIIAEMWFVQMLKFTWIFSIVVCIALRRRYLVFHWKYVVSLRRPDNGRLTSQYYSYKRMHVTAMCDNATFRHTHCLHLHHCSSHRLCPIMMPICVIFRIATLYSHLSIEISKHNEHTASSGTAHSNKSVA